MLVRQTIGAANRGKVYDRARVKKTSRRLVSYLQGCIGIDVVECGDVAKRTSDLPLRGQDEVDQFVLIIIHAHDHEHLHDLGIRAKTRGCLDEPVDFFNGRRTSLVKFV